jgi:membrane protease YdiL (CAAX protease family)
MNFNELEKAWGQQTVTGNRGIARALQQLLITEIQQRKNSIRRVVGIGAFVLVVGWAVTLAAHFTGIRPLNAVTLSVLIAGVIVDAAICVPAYLSWRRVQREAAHMGETLLASMRRSLGVVEWQIRNCTLLSYGLPAAGVVGVLSMVLEYFTHHLPARGLVAGSALTLVFTVALVATVQRYQRRELLPRRDELREQLAALEAA